MGRSGSDKLFQRAKLNFARKPPTKSPRDRILIVSEGEITEPNYFRALCNDVRLSSADVRICGKESDSPPSAVYKFALEELERNLRDKTSDDYDRVYCVFDRDKHDCYDRTLKTIHKKPTHKVEEKTAKVIAINSVPCFEFWVLLHFEYTDKPFENCASLEKQIKTKWATYSKKKTKDVYAELKDKTTIAIKNSKSILKNSMSENPLTMIHLVVDDLISQSKR